MTRVVGTARPQESSRASWYLVVLVAVLAIPRLARMLYPQVWIEDEWYLNGALMLSRGALPYRDFPLPHFPLLEAALAAVFRIFPATIRTAEILTALAALGGSILVFLIGERLAGRAAGTIAALLVATSSVLFRYHVFEREVFDILPVLAAFWLLGKENRGVAAGVLLAIAMAIKLTAVAAFVAIVVQLLAERRRRDAWAVALTASGLMGGATVLLAAIFGTSFIVQVFVFRVVHASFPGLMGKVNEMRYTLDVAFAAGVAGVVFVAWSGRTRRWLGVLLQLASGFLFLVRLNPTYWAHTGIELLPWLALCGGVLLARTVGPWTDRRTAAEDAAPRRTPPRGRRQPAARLASDRVPAWVCAGGAVLLVLFVSPIRNLNWQAGAGSVYGFGYRDRREIARVAAFVRDHTPSNALVATPPIVAFAANRFEVVPYPELAGDIGQLADAVRGAGYVDAIESSPLRGSSFWEGVEASRERIAPVIDRAVAERTAGAVVNFSSNDLFPIPLVDVSQQKLEASGYDLALITDHYEVWIPRR